MPNTMKNKSPSVEQQRAVLRSLSQQVAAELVGKSPSYLRDQSHVIQRNDDGTYDAAEVVRWAVGKCPPASLTDEELEHVLQVTDSLGPGNDRYDLAYQFLGSIVRKYGTAGLAAIGAEVVANMKACHEAGPSEPAPLPSREEFIAEAEREARARAVAEYPEVEACHTESSGRAVTGCGVCDRWRMGRTWHKGELPPGYVRARTSGECPECTAALRGANHA